MARTYADRPAPKAKAKEKAPARTRIRDADFANQAKPKQSSRDVMARAGAAVKRNRNRK